MNPQGNNEGRPDRTTDRMNQSSFHAGEDYSPASGNRSEGHNPRLGLTEYFSGHELRILGTPAAPLFVARDVCEVLEITNSRDALSSLDDDEKGVGKIDTPGGPQDLAVITEAGLYRLTFRSRKKEPKRFGKWVTSEVLPAIRKTGSYGAPKPLPADLTDPATVLAVLQGMSEKALALETTVSEQSEKLAESAEKLEEAVPKCEFFDAVTKSEGDCSMAAAAQAAGLNYGSVTLFRKLRGLGLLISGGSRHNLPKQRYITQGLFNVTKGFYLKDGETFATFTTYVTQKGLEWIVKNLGTGKKA